MNYKYAGRLREGVLVNANAGGENVHRGELFGLSLGAHQGSVEEIKDLIAGLQDSTALASEIDAFVNAVAGQGTNSASPAPAPGGDEVE